ncbi:GAF domain-containing protein [Chloroflexota bacterium]
MVRKRAEEQQITDNTEMDISLQNVVDGVEDELIIIDRESRIIFANSAARDKFLKETESPIGKPCYRVLYGLDKPCTAPLWECPLRKVFESGRTVTVVHPERIPGSDTYLKITAYPLRDNSGGIKSVVELRRDVTAARELESQILRQHHELLALSRVSAALSGLWDLDAILRVALDSVLEIMNGNIGGILLLDEQTQTLYYHVHHGLSAKYVEGMHMGLGEGIAGRAAQSGKALLLEDISVDPHAAHPDLISTEGLKAFISVPLRAKDKVLGVLNVASKMPRLFTENDMHLLNSIGDQLGVAIEEARLYERLRNARERYQKLTRQTLVAQEEERKRMARELHDETSQALSGIELQLQALIDTAEMSGGKDPGFVASLKRVQSLAIQVHGEISRLLSALRPALLDTLGLISAIRQYAESNLRPLGIDVSVDAKGLDMRLPPEVEASLFRWAQGAIGNIAQHSKAKNATITLKCKDNELLIEIMDDGVGFDVSKITDIEESGRGQGVFSMKERIGLLGGFCGIESKPGQGTIVRGRVSIS